MAESQSGPAKVALDENNRAYVERVFDAVFTVGRKAGYNAGSIEDYKPPEHTDIDSDAMITPSWFDRSMTQSMFDTAGVFGHLALQEEFDDVFGSHTGGSSTTAVHVRAGHTVAETVAALIENGGIDYAVEKAELEYGVTTEKAEKMVFFAVAHFAKGWMAEVELTETDAFSKGGVAHDIGGIDAYRGNETVQIKPVSHGYKHDTDGYEHTIIYYHWDCDGHIYYGEDYKEVTRAATENTDKTMTLTVQSRGTLSAEKDLGRAFRYISW